MTVDSLAQALVYATTDKTVQSRAEALGKQIRQEDGVAKAIEAIYRDFEYAKSLIKRNTRLDDGRTLRKDESPGLEDNASDDSSGWDMLSEAGEGGDDALGEEEMEAGNLEAEENHRESDGEDGEGSSDGRGTPPAFLTSQTRREEE